MKNSAYVHFTQCTLHFKGHQKFFNYLITAREGFTVKFQTEG